MESDVIRRVRVRAVVPLPTLALREVHTCFALEAAIDDMGVRAIDAFLAGVGLEPGTGPVDGWSVLALSFLGRSLVPWCHVGCSARDADKTMSYRWCTV